MLNETIVKINKVLFIIAIIGTVFAVSLGITKTVIKNKNVKNNIINVKG